MSIVRSPRPHQAFTIIDNAVLRDERLSMRGLGLLVRLLSRPDNWETNSEVLAREFDCGREQMRSVLKELCAAGYMRLVKEQDAKGHWSSRWFVFDMPELKEEPKTDEPKSEQPEPGKPYAGALGAIKKTDLLSTDKSNTPLTPKGGKTNDDAFDRFWSVYPRKTGKEAARKAFAKLKLPAETLAAILTALAWQCKSDQWTRDNGQYVPNPATYLNQGRWQDEPAAAGSTTSRRTPARENFDAIDYGVGIQDI